MRLPRVLLFILSALFWTLFAAFGTPNSASAQTATSTVVQASSACLQEGCVTTITASVTSGASAVHPGTIIFCDGPVNCENGSPLSRVQLQGDGTATTKLALSPGTHALRAFFHGTNTYSPSQSSTQSLTITSNASTSATTTAISSTGTPGQYTFQGQVTGGGTQSPTGTVSFLDASNGNSILGTGSLGPGQRSLSYKNGLNLSQIPSSILTTESYVATGDFNNDGFQDIAILEADRELAILLGDGKGNFTLAPASNGSRATGGGGQIVVGDFNGDGKLDVAIPNPASYQIFVYLGVGDGTFTAVAPLNLVDQPQQLYLADLNNDGNLDILALSYTGSFADNTGGSSILPLLGRGNGTFTAKSHIIHQSNPSTAPDRFFSVAAADFDRDGKVDFAVPSLNANGTLVYHGNGDGTFQLLPSQAGQVGYSYYIVPGDFDGDGIPDIVGTGAPAGNESPTSILLLHGNGDGTFTPRPPQYTAYLASGQAGTAISGDFNGDGVLDIAQIAYDQSNNLVLQVFPGNGDGTFSVPGSVPALNTNGLNISFAVADFTGDGILDIASFDTVLLRSTTPARPPIGSVGGVTTVAMATSPGGIFLPGTGTQNIVAKYQGDNLHASSVSAPVQLTNSPINDPTGLGGDYNIALNGASYVGVGTPNAMNAYPSYGIQLTSANSLFQSSSFFHKDKVPVHAFINQFDFQLTNANADGFTFTVQDTNPGAVGSTGAGLGYGNPPGITGYGTATIPNSYAIAFDLHSNQGEGSNSIRIETNGVTSGANAVDLTRYGIDLHSGHRLHAQITNTGSDISVTLTDAVTNKSATVDLGSLPAGAFSGDTAYVGFTGSTGSQGATQVIFDWTYTLLQPIVPTTTSVPNFPNGFAGTNQLLLNGGASILGSAIQMTDGTKTFQASSVYFNTKLPAVGSSFDTDFDFAVDNPQSTDGFTFVLQNHSPTAVGFAAGGLGYGPPLPSESPSYGIGNSLAIKFDLHNNAGEGVNSTGLYVNGASPTVPAIDMSYHDGLNLHDAAVFHVHITHNIAAKTLDVTITNPIYPAIFPLIAVFDKTFTVDASNLPTSNDVFVGFTAGTGAVPGSVFIDNWTFTTRSH